MNKDQAKELIRTILRIAQAGNITKGKIDTELLLFFFDQIVVNLNKTPKKKLDINQILEELKSESDINFKQIAFNNHG